VQEFTEVFRAEHRQVRDLLGLAGAFGDRDAGRARALVAAAAETAGPHFRYEEAMYPQLTGILGDARVGKLLAGHDGAIRDARELAWLAGHDELTKEQAGTGTELTRQILPHVSDCDGLAIMVQTLPGEAVSRILAAGKAALDAGLDLLAWATALAGAGQADRACRLAAAAWAALREPRPDLAVRVTAALHGLARHAGSTPGQAGSTGGPPGARTSAGDPVLDVRDLPPARRHESIFAAYQALAPGAGFVLVNDHDPKPLRYQFEAEHAGQFTWDYLEEGPRTWRVRIGRPFAVTPSGPGETDGADGGEEPDLDVRQLPHWQRHDAIFTAYRSLQPGHGFVLVNDHDPLPLRYQFEAQYPGEFTWDYAEAGPRAWRVRIGRAAA
jgi:uncharacterized protein (DUF2249 family)